MTRRELFGIIAATLMPKPIREIYGQGSPLASMDKMSRLNRLCDGRIANLLISREKMMSTLYEDFSPERLDALVVFPIGKVIARKTFEIDWDQS